MFLRWFSRDFFGRFETNLKIVTFWDVILGKWFLSRMLLTQEFGIYTKFTVYRYTEPSGEWFLSTKSASCAPFYLPVWVPYMISVAGCQFTFFLRVLFWADQTWRCERPYFAKGAMRMMEQPRTWSKYLLQLSGQQKNPRMNNMIP